MNDEIKYTQSEDGSRTYNFTLSQEQVEKDQFLGNMKDGVDLLKSWENQKGLIGKNVIPGENASDEEWNKFYEKTRPTNGDYGIEDEKLKKFASDNGLTKRQAAKFAEFYQSETSPDPEKLTPEYLKKQLEKVWGDKMAEKSSFVESALKNSLSEDTNKALDALDADTKVLVARAMDEVLAKFAVKPADFQFGKGATPAAPKVGDRAGYEKEKKDAIASGKPFTDLDDKALRAKYNLGYIDISNIF